MSSDEPKYCADLHCYDSPCVRHPGEASMHKNAMALLMKQKFTFTTPRRQLSTGKPKLQLFFDINKTLIVMDPVAGKDTSKMINSLLSEVVWGRVDEKGEWNCVSTEPSASSPFANDKEVMTFGEYLENRKFRKTVGTTEEIKKANVAKKAEGSKFKTSFTEPGGVGEAFRSYYDAINSRLELPPEVKDQADPRIFKFGRCFILPAFFHLLKHLQEEKRDFSLAFRSFGTEIEEVAAELNLFCTGKHPLFPNVRMDGTNGTTDLRIDFKTNVGAIFISADGSEGVSLTVGSLKPAKEFSENIITGYRPIYDFLLNPQPAGTWGIRDYYPWWADHHESETTGKLLLVDVEDRNILQVFFDDNVERDRAHIVDVRNVHTGEPIPFSKAKKHLVKAEPYLAITDTNFFIDALAACEELNK